MQKEADRQNKIYSTNFLGGLGIQVKNLKVKRADIIFKCKTDQHQHICLIFYPGIFCTKFKFLEPI